MRMNSGILESFVQMLYPTPGLIPQDLPGFCEAILRLHRKNLSWLNSSHRLRGNLHAIIDDFYQYPEEADLREDLADVILFQHLYYNPEDEDEEERLIEEILNLGIEFELYLDRMFRAILLIKEVRNNCPVHLVARLAYGIELKPWYDRSLPSLIELEEGLRQEYPHFSDEEYWVARLDFLQTMLHKPLHTGKTYAYQIPRIKRNMESVHDWISRARI